MSDHKLTMLHKAVTSFHDINSWVYYAATVLIASIGKLTDMAVGNISMHFTAVEGGTNDVIVQISDEGKLFFWGIAVADFLYAIFLLVTIIGALIKAYIDLSNFFYKRKLRKRVKEHDSETLEPYEGVEKRHDPERSDKSLDVIPKDD